MFKPFALVILFFLAVNAARPFEEVNVKGILEEAKKQISNTLKELETNVTPTIEKAEENARKARGDKGVKCVQDAAFSMLMDVSDYMKDNLESLYITISSLETEYDKGSPEVKEHIKEIVTSKQSKQYLEKELKGARDKVSGALKEFIIQSKKCIEVTGR